MINFTYSKLLLFLFVFSFTSVHLFSQATFTGNVFLDQNNDGLNNGTDYGHGVINVMGFEDSDGSGTLNAGDVLMSDTLTDQYGNYTLDLDFTTQDYIIVLDSNSIDSSSIITLPELLVYVYSGSSSNVDFAFLGESVYCYGLSDLNFDAGLSLMNRLTGEDLYIGLTGRDRIESMAIDVKSGILYAANLGQVGIIDRLTGVFTDLPNTAGTGDDGNGNLVDFDDLDGMSIDPFNGTIWVSHRIAGGTNYDLLAQIDTTTGMLVTDAFGAGIDYRVIKDAAELLPYDVDDLAISPLTNELFGIVNGDVGYDLLVKIDKATGIATLVDTIKNSAGVYVHDVEGLSFTTQGVLSASTGNNSIIEDALYHLDEVTAEASFIGDFEYGTDYESCDCHTISTNIASGIVYEDVNEDQIKDPTEIGLANVSIYVYLDLNNDGIIDGTDPIVDSIETDVDGNWSYNVGSNVDLLFDIDTDDLPSGNTLTTDNLEEALFNNSFGGDNDPQNNFGYSSAVLPVELISFTVKQNECAGELNWKSGIEENFAYYQIQRSHDGVAFRNLDAVVGQGGNSLKTYYYQDRLAEAQNFYRLKMVDVDETFKYSSVEELTIDCDKFTDIGLFPNPIHVNHGILSLEYYSINENSKITVSDMLGRPVMQFEESAIALSKNATSIDVSALLPGTYSLKIDNNRYGKLFIVMD